MLRKFFKELSKETERKGVLEGRVDPWGRARSQEEPTGKPFPKSIASPESMSIYYSEIREPGIFPPGI